MASRCGNHAVIILLLLQRLQNKCLEVSIDVAFICQIMESYMSTLQM